MLIRKKDQKIYQDILDGKTDFPDGSIKSTVLYEIHTCLFEKGQEGILKNIPFEAFNYDALIDFISLRKNNITYINESFSQHRQFVKDVLIYDENLYEKWIGPWKKDTDLFLEIYKENISIFSQIKNEPFMTEDMILTYLQVNFQAYYHLNNPLSKEAQEKAFDYLTKTKNKNIFFHIELDGINIVQARKLIKQNFKYFCNLPLEYRNDLSVLCSALNGISEHNRCFDKYEQQNKEVVLISLVENFMKENISVFKFLQTLKTQLTKEIWGTMLFSESFVKNMEERGIDPFISDHKFDFDSYRRQFNLENKMEKQKVEEKMVSVKRKL